MTQRSESDLKSLSPTSSHHDIRRRDQWLWSVNDGGRPRPGTVAAEPLALLLVEWSRRLVTCRLPAPCDRDGRTTRVGLAADDHGPLRLSRTPFRPASRTQAGPAAAAGLDRPGHVKPEVPTRRAAAAGSPTVRSDGRVTGRRHQRSDRGHSPPPALRLSAGGTECRRPAG